MVAFIQFMVRIPHAFIKPLISRSLSHHKLQEVLGHQNMVSATIVRDSIRSDTRERRERTEFQGRKVIPLHKAEGGIEGDSQKKRYLSPALELVEF